MKKIKLIIFSILFLSTTIFADDFIVKKIEVEGLQFINLGTVLTYIPVKVGDRLDSSMTAKVIESLYKSGFFDNVSLFRDGNTLVIKVVERPVISSVKISGNKEIETKQLKEALKQAGILEGQVLDSSTLAGLKQALLEQYYNTGHYNARIDPQVVPDGKGKVALNINIFEGPTAKIKDIRIVGNNHFPTKKLLKEFSLKTTNWLSWFKHDDQYSREKLDADLERLRSFYMDNGYLQFKINSSQVSMTSDKESIYIVIYVTEGAVYSVGGTSLSGNLLGKDTEINNLIDIHPNETFSRRKVINIVQKITKYVGDMGYAFSDVNPQTKVDDVKHQVFINFVVIPGQRVYVRRINFSGNNKTSENVLRREIRQIEGGLFSGSKIEESKRRLLNLGYIKNVDSQLKPVANKNDQTDLQFRVEEDNSAKASLNAGYSDVDGFLYGASLSDSNFMGTGKNVGIQFNNSQDSQIYSFNYYDPYFTKNNVSLNLSLYAQYTDTSNVTDTSSYSTDVTGGTIMHGFPISDYSRLRFGYGYDDTRVETFDDSPKQVRDFIAANGNVFDLTKLYGGWQYSTLDRAIFPTVGLVQSVNLEGGVPVFASSLEYYKASYGATYYHPVTDYFVFSAHGFLGYGGGYGKINKLPFFENYFAGGLGSVRGYETSTLGPKDSNGNAIGGNVSLYGNLGLSLPTFFSNSVRTTVFLDVGNVYDSGSGSNYKVNLAELRYSVGVQLEWNSVLPLVLSLAEPLNRKPGDREEVFQFSIGTSI